MYRAVPSGDIDLDKASWTKSLAEFECGSLLGPYYSTEEVPFQEYE